MITYELLDEMMDNGYPQTTEAFAWQFPESRRSQFAQQEVKILREYIKTQSHQLGSQPC